MRLRKKYRERFLAALLAVSLFGSTMAVPGVLAEKTSDSNAGTTAAQESTTAAQESTETGKKSINAEGVNAEENKENVTESGEQKYTDSNAAESQASKTEKNTDEETSKLPFIVDVTFDGNRLWGANEAEEAEDSEEVKENRFEEPWNGGTSKNIQIQVKKNPSVDTEDGRRYILDLKVSDLFFFNEVPEIKKTSGIKDIKMIQNEAPQVQYGLGETESLKSFSSSSGELRLELDPEAKKIEIPDLKIHYNPQLSGYTGGEQEVGMPFTVELLEADAVDPDTADEADNSDAAEDIAAIGDADVAENVTVVENVEIADNTSETEEVEDELSNVSVLETYAVESVILKTTSLSAKSMKDEVAVNQVWLKEEETDSTAAYALNAEGADGQAASDETTDTADAEKRVLKNHRVEIKKGDVVSYAYGLENQMAQVYQSLVVKLECPYITVDGTDYYLDFSREDEAILENRRGDRQGYSMSAPAAVDEEKHTITYSFANIVLGSNDTLFYTPEFSWSESLNDMEIPEDKEYKINGCSWEIAEQTAYTGAETSLKTSDQAKDTVYFTADGRVAEVNPYEVTVTYEGQKLSSEDGKNVFPDAWKVENYRTLTIEIQRKPGVNTDPSKNYVLSMKVPQVLYFTGSPDANDITGAEKVVMIRNTVPQVNTQFGGSSALPNFSLYSGEIRILLNPATDHVTIPNVAIGYNISLVGYTGANQTVNNPVTISLNTASGDTWETADGDLTELLTYKVDSVVLYTKAQTAGHRNAISIDQFKNAVYGQTVPLGKTGKVSYSCGTAGTNTQVYKSLVVKFHCPFITVGGINYYLSFDQNDPALKNNTCGTSYGFKMSEDVTYDESNHTLTYHFENVYLGGHTVLFYTPEFSWPKDEAIKDADVPDGERYDIKGCNWEVVEQYTTTDQVSTLQSSYDPKNYVAYYIPEKVNIQMVSSAEASSNKGIAKRNIYQGMTRDSGVSGALGFFDIHNDGASDSPDVQITFEFNTDETDQAKYYVTRVNLPAYDNSNGIDVLYTLTNGKDTVSGNHHYTNTSSFSCYVSTLRQDQGVDNNYYIEKISYITKLQKGTKYHLETAHARRNRTNDSGLFFGYIEGKLNSQASATMEIKSLNSTAITENSSSSDLTRIFSTEQSTVSADDYVGYQLYGLTINEGKSASIAAGNSAKLNFGVSISSEEYPHSNKSDRVNGYHVFRDGIFYICLPEDVSISGKEQVTVKCGGQAVAVKSVERTDAECTVDGVNAVWWEIKVPSINAVPGNDIKVEVQLATKKAMHGVTWNFENSVAARMDGQSISWNSASSTSNSYDTASRLSQVDKVTVKALAEELKKDTNADKLGLCLITKNSVTMFTIARAEAKLDVDIGLKKSGDSQYSKNISISSGNTDIEYKVTVSSTDGGAAKDFEYYIPIVTNSSKLDASAMVTRNDFGLSMTGAAKTLNELSGSNDSGPFAVKYTTDSGLTSANIRGSGVTWSTKVSDYSAVTAVKISTDANGEIGVGESYSFSIPLRYRQAGNVFESEAGGVAGWRSFGHYTYVRNNEPTTNTYPNGGVSVQAVCDKDLREDALPLTLDTGAESNVASASKDLPWKFLRDQTLKIKEVKASNGTTLYTDDPSGLTGAEANKNFRVKFGINSGTQVTFPGTSGSWNVSEGNEIKIDAQAEFSKALTDSTTARYVDVTFGNDVVTIIYRIQLNRIVAAADAKASVITGGEVFQVPGVDTQECTITQNSDFTALYVVNGFVPGNYTDRKISWTNKNGAAEKLPKGTAVTMMEISDDSKVTNFWYYKADGNTSEVDLSKFQRMSGSNNVTYQYENSATEPEVLRYLFVFNFENTTELLKNGTYQVVLCADKKEGVEEDLKAELTTVVTEKTTYSLTSKVKSMEIPSVDVTYTMHTSDGNDSYAEGKTLALVLTPGADTKLPADARIKADNVEYFKNSNGDFVIPIGTIEEGTKELSLISAQLPDEKTSYSFDGALWLSGSSYAEAPMNGTNADTCTVKFEKSAAAKPAFRVTGTQVAENAGWVSGQNISFEMKNIPTDGSVTVTAYSGLQGTAESQKVTDLMSSVAGIFTWNDGTGTLNKRSQSASGKLVLSSTAQAGNYRLIFEVKDAAGNAVLTIPYYIIVKESGQ